MQQPCIEQTLQPSVEAHNESLSPQSNTLPSITAFRYQPKRRAETKTPPHMQYLYAVIHIKQALQAHTYSSPQ